MTNMDKFFGLDTRAGQEALAIEDLVFNIQLKIHQTLKDNDISQRELAERIGVSPPRVSQWLSRRGANLTLKTLARIFHALDDAVCVERKSVLEKEKARPQRKRELLIVANGLADQKSRWIQRGSNDNRAPQQGLAA